MTIRGIEKYGKFTKSKKALTGRIKSFVTGHKTPEEEKAEQDALVREKISSSEKKKKTQTQDIVEEHEDGDEEEEKELPGEGKDLSEMTEEEKMDRGIALLVKAFERGLIKEAEKDEGKGANKSSTFDKSFETSASSRNKEGEVKVNAAT